MQRDKILIIFNPAAGRYYLSDFKKYFLSLCEHYLPQIFFNWIETSPDFKNQIKDIDLPDYRRIIVIDGDGTIREIAEFIFNNNLDIPIAIIPAGSHNVLASRLSLPTKLKNAVKIACLNQSKKIDVCVLNGKFIFLTCLSLGYWSKIINNTSQALKNRFGFFAYLLTVARNRKFENIVFIFNIDGRSFKILGNAMLIANALSVFGISPRLPVDFTDGQLEVFINQNKSFLGFLNVAISFLFRKKSTAGMFKSRGKKVIINLPAGKKNAAQLDGEPIKLEGAISIEIIPGKQIKFVF